MSDPKKKWTMKDVQEQLYNILQADHPLTQDERYALKGVIEMCDVWNKISPHFAKVIEEMKKSGQLPSLSKMPGV